MRSPAGPRPARCVRWMTSWRTKFKTRPAAETSHGVLLGQAGELDREECICLHFETWIPHLQVVGSDRNVSPHPHQKRTRRARLRNSASPDAVGPRAKCAWRPGGRRAEGAPPLQCQRAPMTSSLTCDALCERREHARLDARLSSVTRCLEGVCRPCGAYRTRPLLARKGVASSNLLMPLPKVAVLRRRVRRQGGPGGGEGGGGLAGRVQAAARAEDAHPARWHPGLRRRSEHLVVAQPAIPHDHLRHREVGSLNSGCCHH